MPTDGETGRVQVIGVPIAPLLRWALFGALPLAVTAGLIAALAPKNPPLPRGAGTWLGWLTPPVLSAPLAAAGIAVTQIGLGHTDPATAYLTRF